MDYWDGPARTINTLLLVIVALIGFDTLFQLLNANEENAIVGAVATFAGVFLAPFEGMFQDQEFLLTAIIAVLGYSLLAGIALAVTRSIQASRRARARRRAAETWEPGTPQALREADTTRPLGPPPAEDHGAPTAVAPDEDETRPIPPSGPAGNPGGEPTRPTAPRRGRQTDASHGDRTQRLS